MQVRTRFAPSPTGYLHVGGARTALFSWLYARKHQGTFLLRIEDTDAARNTAEARAAIFDGLRWLGLDWDEGPDCGGERGPYNQSERNALYEKWFDKLRADGRIYPDEGAWRFRFRREPITVHDLVCGDVTIDYTKLENTPDMVIRRSDGSYVFHFVNVVDDHEMGITHVIRGEDHLMNTPKHLQLYEAFGVAAPQYAHIPLILNEDGTKMSKRDTGAAVGDYPRRGFLPAAVVNFLALLGWNPKTEEEIFTLPELVERFSLEHVNRAPARFDGEKCAWLNQQHIARLGKEEFLAAARPFLEAAGLPVNSPRLPAAVAAIQEKVRLLTDLPEAVDFLLTDALPDPAPELLARVHKTEAIADLLEALADSFEQISAWSGASAEAALQELARRHELKPGKLMFPVRVALSGKSGGPELTAIFEILGQHACLTRLRHFTQL